MAAFTPYRQVLSKPGGLAFSLAALVGRLPISMAGLGIVLLVEAARGSYGAAGAVSAAYMIANAVLAIVQGRLLDRFGQGRVLTVAAVAFGIATTLLITSVQGDWPIVATYALAALAGASLPQIGSCVRARWSALLEVPAEKQTAFALEAVLDEVVFICGPILVTVLATAVHPVAGLGTAVVAGVGGSLAFAAQRRTSPPPHVRTPGGPRTPLPWRTLAPLAVVSAMLGVLFGAAEVTTVAFADEQGHQAWSGGLLALWALGSLTAGVITGAVSWRTSTVVRGRIGAAAMAVAMVPLPFVDSFPLMGLMLLIGGGAIAPTMVAAMSLVEEVTPPARLTEGMAIVQTGIVAGVAPGATLSGLLVDHQGASAAYLVSVGAGVLAALVAWLIPRNAPRGVAEAPTVRV